MTSKGPKPEELKEVPSLTDSDVSSGESEDDTKDDSESEEESQDEEDEVEEEDSEEANDETYMSDTEDSSTSSSKNIWKTAEELKQAGNTAFKESKYGDAIDLYKKALNADKISMEDKAKCYGNMSHCYVLWQSKYKEALEAGKKSIECSVKGGNWPKAYLRCSAAYVKLNQPGLAALTLKKGLTLAYNAPLKEEFNKAYNNVELRGRTEAEDYIHRNHGDNAHKIDLDKAAETGLKPKPKPAKGKKPKQPLQGQELPSLIQSASEDEDSDSEDSISASFPDRGPNPSPPRRPRQRDEDVFVPNKVEPTGIKNPAGLPTAKKNDGQTFRPGFLVHSNNDPVKKIVPEKKTAPAPQPQKPLVPRPQSEEVKPQKEPERDVFMRVAREGSSCYKESIFQGAKDKFGECLALIDSSYKALNFSQPVKKSSEVVVIKFMYARACTGQHTYKDIISGYDKFNEILNLHKEVRFPAVYLGLALMFQKLNRYEQALTNAEKGVEWFDNNLPCLTYSYPGSNADPISETKKDYLKDFFIKLKIELKCPPRPDAVCKYSECLKINQDNHIIPSEKIFKSDPNFKPFYRIFCTSSCTLDYHDSCWSSFKSDISKDKGSKAPTEKDFCGKNCFTPDCEGIMIKIQIVDAMEISKTIENQKLKLELEQEEKARREAEKLRKAEELKKQQLKKLEARANNVKKKGRSRSKSVASDISETSDNKTEGNNFVKPNNDNNNDDEKINPYENLPDLTKVPVAILRKKDKDEDVDDENLDNKKKEKKKKEKATLSLGEFNGTTDVRGNETERNRIEKLAAMKKTHENYNPGAGSFINSAIDRNLNPNAKSFNPVLALSKTTVEESVKTYVYDQLSKYGPMKDSDIRLTKDLGTEARQVIIDGSGLLPLLKSDERFGSYSSYLCLKGDAEKAKKLKDEDDKKMQELKSSTSQINGSLGDTARKLKEQLVKEKTPSEIKENGFGLQNVSEEPSLLERIKKDASVKLPTLGAGPNFRTEGVQTDVSSINVDADDPYVLQQSNELLAAELQTVTDKLVNLQNKSKLDRREQADTIARLESEKLVMELKVQDLQETINRREQTFKEAAKTQKELRTTKESYEASHRKNVSLDKDLKKVKKDLENEQLVSFHLRQKVDKIREKDDTIKILKLKCLKSDFERKKDSLIQKRQDNEMLIENLGRMSNTESNGASSAAIRDAIDKLNAFSASLYTALDTLRLRYDERKQGIETDQASNHHTEVNFEVTSIGSPNLDSLELNTLRLLTTANFNTNVRPSQVTPFSQPPPHLQSRAPARAPQSKAQPRPAPQPQPQSRAPPGLLGASASLSPPSSTISSTSSSSTDSNFRLPKSSSSNSNIRSNPAPGRNALPPFHSGAMLNPPPQLASNSAPSVISPPSRAQHISPPSSAPTPRVQGSSGAHAGASFNQPPTSSGDIKKPKSTEKLVQQILARNPQLTAEQADMLIQMLRSSNNGKLSGLSVQQILKGVEELMRQEGLASGARREMVEETRESECSICMENMMPRAPNVRRLPCSHSFHSNCINDWLATPGGAGNTCPLCREYIVAEDQFPGLGQRVRRRN